MTVSSGAIVHLLEDPLVLRPHREIRCVARHGDDHWRLAHLPLPFLFEAKRRQKTTRGELTPTARIVRITMQL